MFQIGEGALILTHRFSVSEFLRSGVIPHPMSVRLGFFTDSQFRKKYPRIRIPNDKAKVTFLIGEKIIHGGEKVTLRLFCYAVAKKLGLDYLEDGSALVEDRLKQYFGDKPLAKHFSNDAKSLRGSAKLKLSEDEKPGWPASVPFHGGVMKNYHDMFEKILLGGSDGKKHKVGLRFAAEEIELPTRRELSGTASDILLKKVYDAFDLAES